MNYSALSEDILKKYAARFEGRQLAFEYLDYYLRLLESSAGEDILMPALKSKLHGCFYRRICSGLLFCWLVISPKPFCFVFFRTTTFSSKYARKVFDALTRRRGSAQGILTNEVIGSGKKKIQYLLSQGLVFELFRRSMFFYCVLKRFNVVDSASMKVALGFEGFLDQINRAIEIDLRRAVNTLKKWRPRALVLNADQTPEAHLIVRAASDLGIRTCVIAHGYFKNPWWVSVLPLYSERLYVWTEDVKLRVLAADRKCPVFTLDGIKSDCIAIDQKPERKILVAGSPLYQYESNPEYLRAFRDAIVALGEVQKKLDVEVVYKPHPLESNHTLLDKILASNGIKKSDEEIYKAAARSLAVCGGLTSFLYEAAQSGIPAVQIKELSVFEPDEGFDGVPICAAAEIGSVLFQQINVQCSSHQSLDVQNHQQDVEAFASWLLGQVA